MITELLQSAAPAPMLFAMGQKRTPVQVRANRKDKRKAVSDKRLRTRARHAEQIALQAVRAATDADTRLSALIAWGERNALAHNGIARMVAPSIGAFAAGVVNVQTLDDRVRARLAKQAGGAGLAR